MNRIEIMIAAVMLAASLGVPVDVRRLAGDLGKSPRRSILPDFEAENH